MPICLLLFRSPFSPTVGAGITELGGGGINIGGNGTGNGTGNGNARPATCTYPAVLDLRYAEPRNIVL